MASGTITRGDTEVLQIYITNPNNSVRNITTDTLKCTIKISPYSSTYVVQKLSTGGSPGIVKVTPASGYCEVTLLPTDLLALSREGILYCDMEVTDSTGKVATELFNLNFVLDIS